MSHTNDLILSELRDKSVRSTPSRSNQWYELDVQCWLWFYLGELGIWNFNPHCHCQDSWVEETAFSFQKYAKDIWEKTGRSYRNIQQRHKAWLDTPMGDRTFENVILAYRGRFFLLFHAISLGKKK